MVDRVHADAVPEEGAPGPPPGRVHRDDRDAQAVAEREPRPAYELVGHRRLAGAPGPGDPEDGRGPAAAPRPAGRERGGIDEPALDAGDGAGERAEVAGAKLVPGHPEGARVEGAARAREHVVHHPLQAHPLAVLRGVDAGDAVLVQLAHLLGHDDPAAAAEDPHVPRPPLAEPVQHVPEVLEVPALVGADRDPVHVLVDGGGHHLLDGAVVAEMDHLRSRPLEEPPHDVDRRVVAVEEARGGDEAKGERGLGGHGGRGFLGSPVSEGRFGHESRVGVGAGWGNTERYARRSGTSISSRVHPGLSLTAADPRRDAAGRPACSIRKGTGSAASAPSSGFGKAGRGPRAVGGASTLRPAGRPAGRAGDPRSGRAGSGYAGTAATGRDSRPRSTTPPRYAGRSARRRSDAKRSSSTSRKMRPSRRARGAPMQWWMPRPNEM